MFYVHFKNRSHNVSPHSMCAIDQITCGLTHFVPFNTHYDSKLKCNIM